MTAILTKLDELGEALRIKNYVLSIVYGSGGYCVMITHKNREYVAFSHDITKAIDIVLKKASKGKEDNSEDITLMG